MAWTPFPDKNNDQPVQLPNCFALCDGSEIIEGTGPVRFFVVFLA